MQWRSRADGKIVAAGYAYPSASPPDFALARYNSDGSLDTTFSGDGKVVTDFASLADGTNAVAIQSDGKIVAAGYTTGSSGDNFALARYNADGSLDTSFGGGDGLVTTDFGVSAWVLVWQYSPMARSWWRVRDVPAQSMILRWRAITPTALLDTSFGSGDGMVTTDFFGNDDYAYAMAIQSDGKIVAAGYATSNNAYYFALVRYTSRRQPGYYILRQRQGCHPIR